MKIYRKTISLITKVKNNQRYIKWKLKRLCKTGKKSHQKENSYQQGGKFKKDQRHAHLSQTRLYAVNNHIRVFRVLLRDFSQRVDHYLIIDGEGDQGLHVLLRHLPGHPGKLVACHTSRRGQVFFRGGAGACLSCPAPRPSLARWRRLPALAIRANKVSELGAVIGLLEGEWGGLANERARDRSADTRDTTQPLWKQFLVQLPRNHGASLTKYFHHS